jgi:hypothetical protein
MTLSVRVQFFFIQHILFAMHSLGTPFILREAAVVAIVTFR